jgi:hypothetical protein
MTFHFVWSNLLLTKFAMNTSLVLDMWRLMVLHPAVLERLQTTFACPLVDLIAQASELANLGPSVNALLGVRVLVNLASTSSGRKVVGADLEKVSRHTRSSIGFRNGVLLIYPLCLDPCYYCDH